MSEVVTLNTTTDPRVCFALLDCSFVRVRRLSFWFWRQEQLHEKLRSSKVKSQKRRVFGLSSVCAV